VLHNGADSTEILNTTRREIMSEIVRFEDVERRVLTIRGQQVLIDRDVAELYGVETKKVNQAVKRNLDKFPMGYILAFNESEKHELVTNCDRFDMLKHSTALPTAFTKKDSTCSQPS